MSAETGCPGIPNDGFVLPATYDAPDDGRLSGLDRNAVHQNARLPQRVDGLDRVIAKTHGASAGDEHDVRTVQRLVEAFFDDAKIVGEDIFSFGFAARLEHPRRKGKPVDVAHLALAGRLARVDQFIPRGQYRHPGAAMNFHRRDSHARERAHVLTPETGTRSQNQLVLFEIIAYRENILAHGGGAPDLQSLRVRSGR